MREYRAGVSGPPTHSTVTDGLDSAVGEPGVTSQVLRSARLRPFGSARGAMCVLALDHRDAMVNAYRRHAIPGVTEAIMLEAKARIIESLAGAATAVLLDSLAASLPRPSGLGLLMPLETQGHDRIGEGRANRLMDAFGPEQAAGAGADGCKLLLYYRADHPASAEKQLQLAANAAASCHRHGLALVVEPKVYPLDGEELDGYHRRFGDLVVAAARDLAPSGADLLKLQYPGSPELCRAVASASGPLRWTLLGGAVDGDTFAGQLLDACCAGASGFIAGRAIWGDALMLEPQRQAQWLDSHARPLLERLCKISDMHARRIV